LTLEKERRRFFRNGDKPLSNTTRKKPCAWVWRRINLDPPAGGGKKKGGGN